MGESKYKFKVGDGVKLIGKDMQGKLPAIGKIIDINVNANGTAQYYVEIPFADIDPGGIFLVAEEDMEPHAYPDWASW